MSDLNAKVLMGIVFVAIAIVVGYSLFFGREDTPRRNVSASDVDLIAVCEGYGTSVVECTFIPKEESLRTKSEKEIAERAEGRLDNE